VRALGFVSVFIRVLLNGCVCVCVCVCVRIDMHMEIDEAVCMCVLLCVCVRVWVVAFPQLRMHAY